MAVNIFFVCDSNVNNVQYEPADDPTHKQMKVNAAKCYFILFT